MKSPAGLCGLEESVRNEKQVSFMYIYLCHFYCHVILPLKFICICNICCEGYKLQIVLYFKKFFLTD